ncbi:MAG: arabinan endo-1,5-alpha-L-arabinosidase [Ruminococcaceae bacterium]|nr:arabinan endo-1,5-alpha-L-arabinosidase [Oscillospiraceae bacterium]
MQFKIKNPIDSGWYADPEARIYKGKYYIYATKSRPYKEQLNQVCFVSENLSDWKRIDDIIDMSTFPWAWQAVWAPTIIEKDNKYYYVFATNDIQNDSEIGGLEIAVSDKPEGPFKGYLGKPLIGKFINKAQPIDAHLFKDDDGTIYLLYGGWGHCNIARMNENMDGFVPFENGEEIIEITPPDYVEGPCMFKKDGKYGFMWSAGGWTNGTYHVNVAFADTPFGPFDDYKVILETGGSTFANGPGHNGYFYIPEENIWLNVYHRHQNGINDGNARFMCLDLMEFEDTFKIKPVTMTTEWEYDDGKVTIKK